MKTLLVSLLLIQFLDTAAQKCRFTIDKKDEFTNEKVNAIARANSGWTWTSSKKGAKYFIEMTFLMAGEDQKPMTTKDSVMIKLADGTILHLKPIADVLPVNGAVSTTTGRTGTTSKYSTRNTAVTKTTSVSTFSPTYEVDRSTFEQLSKSQVTAIRYGFTGKAMDFDLTKRPLSKTAPDLVEDAKCILGLN